MKLLIIDNFDSFTYNLVKIIRDINLHISLSVFRNNEISVADCRNYDKILISPGPGLPKNAGIVPDMIKELSPEKDILGICLGHQGIAETFGANLFNLHVVLHGISNVVKVLDPSEVLFSGLPPEFRAGHYHSWSVDSDSISPELIITAVDEEGLIMGIRHSQFLVRGLQFHPESIMTEYGDKMIINWIKQ